MHKMHENIRKRPAMYIGRIGSSGLSQLLGDLILESATTLEARDIKMELQKSGKISLTLSDGSIKKNIFNASIEGVPPINALALTVCVALSTSFVITLDGKKYKVSNQGVVSPPLQKTSARLYREMKFTFNPDQAIFGGTGPEGMMLYQLTSEVALTVPDVKIVLRSNYTQPVTQIVAHCPKGIQDLLDLQASKSLGRSFEHCIRFDEGEIHGQVGWFYPPHIYFPSSDGVLAFANGRSTSKGGSHVEGAVEGIRDAVTGMVAGREEDYYLEMGRIVRGLCLVVSVWGDDLRYAGSTKECLDHEVSKSVVRKVVKQTLEKWMKTSPEEAKEFLKLFQKAWPFGNPFEQIKKL